MRIAVAQMSTQAGDLEGTIDRMLEYAQSAADQGADLVVFPLMALTGPMPVDYPCIEGFAIDVSTAIQRLRDKTACPCVVSFVDQGVEGPCSTSLFLKDGASKPLGTNLPMPEDLWHTTHALTPSRDAVSSSTFEFAGATFAVAYSYDDIDALLDDDVKLDVLLYVSAYPFILDDAGSVLGNALSENRFALDATGLDAWIVGAGSLGGYGTQTFTGGSFVLTPRGELVASAPAFEEALLVGEVDTTMHEELAEPLKPEIYNRTLHLWETLSLGLKDYLSGIGFTDAALVLDGTLNSSLLAVLATDALGPTHVHGLICAPSGTDRDEAARRLAQAVHINAREFNTSVLDGAPAAALRDACQIQLAALARETKSLAISNEDKTYLALEETHTRCTVAGLLPFGDVYRSDLIELAHLRNTISPVIPLVSLDAYEAPDIEGLAEAEPTSEMRLRLVDVTLANYVEWERSLTEIVRKRGHAQLTKAILHRLREVEPMRATAPLSLVVSSRTLFDARMPFGFGWYDRVRSAEELEDAIATQGLGEAPGTIGGKKKFKLALGGQDLSNMFDDLSSQILGGELPEGVTPEDVEASVGDLFGLLRDLAQSGGLSLDDDKPRGNGPFGPLTWGSPFSEN